MKPLICHSEKQSDEKSCMFYKHCNISPCNRNDTVRILSISGFTMLELIVVVCIISMMLAVALPSFSALKDRNIRSEAGRIASVMRYLNDRAISTKESCTMQINIKQGLVYIRAPEGDKTERIENLSAVTLQSKGRVSDGEVTISFSPIGTGEHFTIHLTSAKASMDIAFNALSGRVKVSMYEKV